MADNGKSLTVQRTRELLEARTEEFAVALAGRVDPGAFVRVAYTTITKSPKLLEATPASLLMALLECASLGLVPNSVMGEAYLVPFNNKIKEPGGKERWEVQAQFIPGFRGLAKLARQSGHIRAVTARIVREEDVFEVSLGTEERIHHVPEMDGKERPMLRVYAVAFLRDGPPQFDVMEKWEVDRIRAMSKSKSDGPWVQHYDEMAKKTVFRRLAKLLPLSDTDLDRALEADNRDFDMSASVRGGASLVADLNRSLAGDAEEAELSVVEAAAPAEAAQPAAASESQPASSHAEGEQEGAEHTAALAKLLLLIRDTPKGDGRTPAADDGHRSRLTALSAAVMSSGNADEAGLLIKLIADPSLSKVQATRMLLRGREAGLLPDGEERAGEGDG